MIYIFKVLHVWALPLGLMAPLVCLRCRQKSAKELTFLLSVVKLLMTVGVMEEAALPLFCWLLCCQRDGSCL